MAKKKSKKRLWIIISIVLIAAIAITSIIISKRGKEEISVVTSKVERRTITQTVSAIGTIEPETEVKISSETSGEILNLNVKEGDTVSSGDLLIRIKPDIIQTQLEQQKAASEASKMEIESRKAEKERASADFNRVSELYKKEFASKQEFDQAKAAYDVAIAGYQAALKRYEQSQALFRQVQRNAARTTIYSPISGVITGLVVEEGEKVVGTAQMQGTEMMRVSDLSVMNAVVDVDENDIVKVKIGDKARVEVDALPDDILTGTVVEIGHSAKQSNLGTQDQVIHFEVKVRITDEDRRLRPGMSCNVDIETKTQPNVLSVPLQAVTVREDDLERSPDVRDGEYGVKKEENNKAEKEVNHPQSVVFIKDGNKAKMQEVKIGISDKGFIEIISGLSEGEEIISGSFRAVSKELYDGAEIKVDSAMSKKYQKFRNK